LAEAGFAIEPYAKHYGEVSVPDEDWIALTAARGWIGLTRDKRIRYLQADHIMTVAARVVILKSKISNLDFATALVRHKRRLNAFINRSGPRFIGRFKASAEPDGSLTPSVEMWLDPETWADGLKRKELLKARNRP